MEGFKYNIPYTYKKINDERSSSIKIDKFVDNDDYELVLIETPKNFDKSRLNEMKLTSFESEELNGEKVLDNYSAIIKNYNTIPKQIMCMLKSSENSFFLKSFDRYMKLYEVFEDIKPQEDSIIPKKIITKQSLLKTKRKRKTSNLSN